jgi:hypothetical protein
MRHIGDPHATLAGRLQIDGVHPHSVPDDAAARGQTLDRLAIQRRVAHQRHGHPAEHLQQALPVSAPIQLPHLGAYRSEDAAFDFMAGVARRHDAHHRWQRRDFPHFSSAPDAQI